MFFLKKKNSKHVNALQKSTEKHQSKSDGHNEQVNWTTNKKSEIQAPLNFFFLCNVSIMYVKDPQYSKLISFYENCSIKTGLHIRSHSRG